MPDDFWHALVDPLTDRELEILRHVASGSSDREIAQSLFLSLNTIKWHNRQIYSKLGVGSRTQAVNLATHAGLLETPSTLSGTAVAERGHNIPAQVTSFIGREQEIAEVRQLLISARLLTLTGPPGVGKTRLALKVAAESAEEDTFHDGIYFVDLAPLGEPEQVATAVADALGVASVHGHSIPQILEKYLDDKALLLLLDNFEHLLDAGSLVTDLLAASPDPKFMVTSRETLSLYGEQEYPVQPLRLPDLALAASPSKALDHEAVALFVGRAQAVNPDFELSAENAPVVSEICVRLDGLPLAIELAAAQVKFYSPQALLKQLENRFDVLKTSLRGLAERQLTLRGAIDWSYELLSPSEKTLLARLSVFQGGRSIEAVEATCCHELPIDVLDGLTSLLNKNLLRIEHGFQGEPRFTMLETIHEYARERIRDSGEAEEMRRRHAEFFTVLAERAELDTRGSPITTQWLQRLEEEHDNLRTMLRWSLDGGEIELGLRTFGVLSGFWFFQGYHAEARRWTERALEVVGSVPAEVRAGVYYTAGRAFSGVGEYAAARSSLGEALAIYRERGSKLKIGRTLTHLSAVDDVRPQEYKHTLALAEEAIAIFREIDDQPGIMWGLVVLGELARLHEDLPRATEAYEESLSIARRIGDSFGELIALVDLGLVAQHEGNADRAQAQCLRALAIAKETSNIPFELDTLAYLAGAEGARGRLARAARLYGTVEAKYVKYGLHLQAGDLPEYRRVRSHVREELGEPAFNAFSAEGRAMSLEEAIAYALEQPGSGT